MDLFYLLRIFIIKRFIMRRFDKKKNMTKANLLAEQRYFQSKGLLKEESLKDKLSNLEGKPISLIKTLHTVKYNPERGGNDKVTKDEYFDGIIGQIGDYEGHETPGFFVMDNNGKKKGFVMYDNKSGNFIEGDSTFSYTYKGKTTEDEGILQLIKNTVLNNVNENNAINEETFNDLFNFLEQDPRKMGGASVMYVNLVEMNKNYINPETGQKESNPMWGKIYKHTRFMFRWEDTYGRAVERENPEHEMGQRSGTYEKIDGYDMLEQGKSGLYLPIIPTGSESTYSISEDGKSHEPISYEEIKPYMKEYKPSTGGSGVKFRPLIVDRIAKIKAGGNEWNNPNFVFGNYIGPNS